MMTEVVGGEGDRFPGSEPMDSLSDRLLPAPELTPNSRLQPADAALLEKLEPGQLRAVATWMRAMATTYDHKAPASVGHSFRTQASRIDQLARQHQPAEDAVVGTLMSSSQAYWMTAAGEYWRQTLGQGPGTADAPAERCSAAVFSQAYLNPDFTVLLGAERLLQRFGLRPDLV